MQLVGCLDILAQIKEMDQIKILIIENDLLHFHILLKFIISYIFNYFLFEKHAKMRIESRMWQNDGIVDRKYKAVYILSLETYINNLEKRSICYLTDFITPNSKINIFKLIITIRLMRS